MVEEPQGQGGLDGEIRVAPLPTPPAAPARRPGSDRFRGQPHRHIAASNKGLIVGRPVRNAVLRLIRGMDLIVSTLDDAKGTYLPLKAIAATTSWSRSFHRLLHVRYSSSHSTKSRPLLDNRLSTASPSSRAAIETVDGAV